MFVGGTAGDLIRAHSVEDGATNWIGPNGVNFGVLPVENGRVYAANSSSGLFCLDSGSGEVLWTYADLLTNNGAMAIGFDGTIYVAEAYGPGSDLIAVSDDGEEMWRYAFDEQVVSPPIVAGDGTIYFGSFINPSHGHVHAVRADGTALWTKELPDYAWASPMLAPDGALYIMCRDKVLYAFKDPAKGDVSLNDIIDGRDIRFFIRVLFGVDDNEIRFFAADMNSDGVVDVNDVPLFVDALLTVQN